MTREDKLAAQRARCRALYFRRKRARRCVQTGCHTPDRKPLAQGSVRCGACLEMLCHRTKLAKRRARAKARRLKRKAVAA